MIPINGLTHLHKDPILESLSEFTRPTFNNDTYSFVPSHLLRLVWDIDAVTSKCQVFAFFHPI